ncbi:MAG: hypothetical protein IJ600_11955, partial [Lachnospiraceae bacterium]|nr:hypothetical protein [Lachnospiraceae bacterium]
KEMKDAYMDSLEPYDFSKITDYNPAYMSGYVASKYDEDANEVKERVDRRIRSTVESEIRKTVNGYDSVSEVGSKIDINDGRIRYCMLPVWMLSTVWNGNVYSFAMNGQTGKVVGDLPIDSGKSARLFIITAVITAVICGLISYIFLDAGGSGIIASVVIGLIVAAISLSSAKAAMVASVKNQASEYLKKDSFKLLDQTDNYMRTREELIRKAQNS